jgi:ABC-type sugar transport system ATPase subunit
MSQPLAEIRDITKKFPGVSVLREFYISDGRKKVHFWQKNA